MAESYIPARGADALVWMSAFSGGLSTDPAAYQVSGADAAAVAAAVAAFDTARTPATRTPGAVAAKDATRNAAALICRQFAMLIKLNAGISDEQKIDVGVRPVNNSRQPIECPQTAPLLNAIAATPGSQTLRFADSMTPDSPAKPFGASELLLFVAVGAGPVADPGQAEFYGKFTRNPVSVAFDPAANGKQATYFARWASRRGEMGPFPLPVTLAIAA